MNIFFIESPLQLLNALEASDIFCDINDEKLFIIFYSLSFNSNKQLEKILKENFRDFKVIKIQQSKIKIIKPIKYIFLAMRLKKELIGCKRVFIGSCVDDYPWMFANTFNVNEIIILDDGMSTATYVELFKDLNKVNKNINKVKNLLFNLFGLENSNRKYCTFFTILNLKSTNNYRIIKNNFINLKSNRINLKQNKDVVYFIGSGMVEANIFTDEYHLCLLDKIFKNYSNKKIIYIPHRFENTNSLLNKFPSVIVKRFDNIIELEFMFKKINPTHIASFYSTALITLNSLYNIERVDIYKFNLNILNVWKFNVTKIYEYLENEFPIIEIDCK